jgi:hypothetical protein
MAAEVFIINELRCRVCNKEVSAGEMVITIDEEFAKKFDDVLGVKVDKQFNHHFKTFVKLFFKFSFTLTIVFQTSPATSVIVI